MSKKIYHVSTCTTNQRILKELKPGRNIELQDIKKNKLTPQQIDELKFFAGSYEALFSRRAIKFKSLGYSNKKLSEKDYRRLILEEYTFLKRPVILAGEKIFIGNAPSVIDAAKKTLKN